MTKEITITVTQEDIDQGIRNDCDKCPIARAIARELPGSEPSVGDMVDLYGKGYYGDAHLSHLATKFINDFDNGNPVVPQAFHLEFTDFKSPTA